MTKQRCLLAVLLSVGVLLGAAAQSMAADESASRETADFREVHAQALELAKRHGARRVLVVCDIDDTLLAGNQLLGCHPWFDWQQQLIEENPKSPDAVGPTFSDLLRAQGLLYAIGGMHPPQPEQPGLLRDLQDRHFTVIAQTSRGPDLRDVTRRELLRNGFDLRRSSLPEQQGLAAPYLPFDPKQVEASGISAAEAKALALDEPPRPVSYSEGVYMTSGQHKGALLRMLLHRYDAHFDALLFVDDSARNVQAVEAAYGAQKKELVAIRYTRQDARAAVFKKSDKRAVVRQWQQLRELAAGFPQGQLPVTPSVEVSQPLGSKIRIATLNCEFLLRGKVHMKYGLPFDPRDFSDEQKRRWTPEYREARYSESVAAVAKLIVAIQADLIGLTEVGDARDVADLQRALNALGLDYPHREVGQSGDFATGQHVAVLSRIPLDQVLRAIPGRECYDREPDDPITEDSTSVTKGMRVRFQLEGVPVYVYVLHFASERGGHEKDEQRIAQASIVRRHYLPLLDQGAHVVVLGDLNDRRAQPAIRRVRGRDDIGEDLLQTGGPAFSPKARTESVADYNARIRDHWSYEFSGQREQIDHILISNSLRDACVSGGVSIRFIDTDRPRIGKTEFPPTDHRGVALDLQLAP